MLSCSIIGAFCPLVSTMLQVVVMVILLFPALFFSLTVCSSEHIRTVVSLLRRGVITVVIALGLRS